MVTRRTLAHGLAWLVPAASGALSATSAQAASTTRSGSPDSSSSALYYLALGDSITAGWTRTVEGWATVLPGYTGAVTDRLNALNGGRVQLRNLACNGETSATLLTGGMTWCERWPAGSSQLDGALMFLRSSPGKGTRWITLAIGFNDVQNTLTLDGSVWSLADADAAITAVSRNLGAALAKLRAAAKQAQILVLGTHVPNLAIPLAFPQEGTAAQRQAESVARFDKLHAAIATEARKAGATYVDIPAALHQASLEPVATDCCGVQQERVAEICSLSWACSFMHDVHINAAGHARFANAVFAAIKSPVG